MHLWGGLSLSSNCHGDHRAHNQSDAGNGYLFGGTKIEEDEQLVNWCSEEWMWIHGSHLYIYESSHVSCLVPVNYQTLANNALIIDMEALEV